MAKPNPSHQVSVLVLFGGESPEHEVSIASAKNVVAALDAKKFVVGLAYIDKQGRWWLADKVSDKLDTTKLPRLYPKLGDSTWQVDGQDDLRPDVLLPILHGNNGEDGTVQGLARLLHVPIVGCGVLASAVCMDKVVAKRLLHEAGLPVVPYRVHQAADAPPKYDELVHALGPTLFVKPTNAGSSVGVSKVSRAAELAPALKKALQYGKTVLVEQAIDAREIEVAVMGNDQPQAAPPGEIVPDREFYDYDSKYAASSKSKVVIPAELDESTRGRVEQLAVAAYRTLDCAGLARVDFLLDKRSSSLFVNELNTLPGFTNISMFPKLWDAAGLKYPQLLEKLISFALEK